MPVDHLYWEATCRKCDHTWRPETRKLEIALNSDLPVDCPACGFSSVDHTLALIDNEPEV